MDSNNWTAIPAKSLPLNEKKIEIVFMSAIPIYDKSPYLDISADKVIK